jgi:hypothetical protein
MFVQHFCENKVMAAKVKRGDPSLIKWPYANCLKLNSGVFHIKWDLDGGGM